jgi:alkylated DNA repair protein (DNA oxidative demethylase)
VQNHTEELFAESHVERRREPIAPGAWLLHGFALDAATSLRCGVQSVAAAAPFRHWHTPGGQRMSVAMTNCGRMGWMSDRRGYRYQSVDPLTGSPWPAMPATFRELAQAAAAAAGFDHFDPDACLVNRYRPGTRMSLHQDQDEADFGVPIVSVSLGLPAIFRFGGDRRSDKPQPIPLRHGDVVVWGGPARLKFHGVSPLKDGEHAEWGSQRINLTFRRAL